MRTIVAVLVLAVVLSSYLAWLAGRLDRLQVRCEAALDALDAHLVRRAVAALAVARDPQARDALRALDPQLPDLLAGAAAAALDARLEEREACENALTRALRLAHPALGDVPDTLARDLENSVERVALARQFHNDAVRHARLVRRRFVVRLFRLAGRSAAPRYFEIDDAADLYGGLR